MSKNKWQLSTIKRKYNTCIALTIATLNYLFENDIFIIQNKDDEKELKISLDKNGFIMREQTLTNLVFEDEGTQVDLVYVLGLLFQKDSDKEYEITKLLKNISSYILNEPRYLKELVRSLNSNNENEHSIFEDYLKECCRYQVANTEEVCFNGMNNCEQVISSIDLKNKTIGSWDEYCDVISAFVEEDLHYNINEPKKDKTYYKHKISVDSDKIINSTAQLINEEAC